MSNLITSIKELFSDPLSLSFNGAALFVSVIAVGWGLALRFTLKLIGRKRHAEIVVSLPVYVMIGLFITIIIITIVGGFVSPTDLPRHIGAIGIIASFFAVLLVITLLLDIFRMVTGFAVGWLLLVVAFCCTVSDINNNHQVRTSLGSRSNSRDLPYDFRRWLASRKDLDYYQGRVVRYPVYIVAAEGGGIYAAYHAAMVLARLQDYCSNFAQHLFAISSVSGGSLGAAVFSGLSDTLAKNMDHETCRRSLKRQLNTPTLEQLTESVLSQDFLSPLIYGLLFPDFLQRFVPAKVGPFDRARWLETSFEETFARIGSKRFSDPFLRWWRPTEAAPAILMNTTSVATGERVVLTPFKFDDSITGRAQVKTIHTFLNTDLRDISVSTAISLSARFPWITPAGSLTESAASKLADGGYFESSGVETALDVIQRVNKLIVDEGLDDKVSIRLVIIQSWIEEPTSALLDEILSPVNTMLATRVARGGLAKVRAYNELCPRCLPLEFQNGAVWPKKEARSEEYNRQPIILHSIEGNTAPLPLGWDLGRRSEEFINAQLGVGEACRTGQGTTYF